MEPRRFSSCDGGGNYADELCARAEVESRARSGADVILDLVSKVQGLADDVAFAHRRIKDLQREIDGMKRL